MEKSNIPKLVEELMNYNGPTKLIPREVGKKEVIVAEMTKFERACLTFAEKTFYTELVNENSSDLSVIESLTEDKCLNEGHIDNSIRGSKLSVMKFKNLVYLLWFSIVERVSLSNKPSHIGLRRGNKIVIYL